MAETPATPSPPLRSATVVVLAAGDGARLGCTPAAPKPLVEIEGEPILRTLLLQVRAFHAGPIVIATTAHSTVVDALARWTDVGPISVTHVPGPPTSDLVSLEGTMSAWQGDLVVLDADLVVSSKLLGCVFGSDRTAVVIDRSASHRALDMRVALRADGSLRTLSKSLTDAETDAEFLGMSRFCAAEAALLGKVLRRRAQQDPHTGSYESAISELADTSLIDSIEVGESGLWIDIDTPADLAWARAHARRIRTAG